MYNNIMQKYCLIQEGEVNYDCDRRNGSKRGGQIAFLFLSWRARLSASWLRQDLTRSRRFSLRMHTRAWSGIWRLGNQARRKPWPHRTRRHRLCARCWQASRETQRDHPRICSCGGTQSNSGNRKNLRRHWCSTSLWGKFREGMQLHRRTSRLARASAFKADHSRRPHGRGFEGTNECRSRRWVLFIESNIHRYQRRQHGQAPCCCKRYIQQSKMSKKFLNTLAITLILILSVGCGFLYDILFTQYRLREYPRQYNDTVIACYYDHAVPVSVIYGTIKMQSDYERFDGAGGKSPIYRMANLHIIILPGKIITF